MIKACWRIAQPATGSYLRIAIAGARNIANFGTMQPRNDRD